jgi:hypothetical protein
VQAREEDRGPDPGEKPDPDRARGEGDGRREEGGGEDLALQPDVEDARAFGIEPREAGQQERRGEPDGLSRI